METRTSQDTSICCVTHQVVSRLLLGAVHAVQGDAQRVRGKQAVGAAGQTHAVQCPVQHASAQAELRARRACGCEAGADTQDWILRGNHCYVWEMDTQDNTIWLRPSNVKLPELTQNYMMIIELFCVLQDSGLYLWAAAKLSVTKISNSPELKHTHTFYSHFQFSAILRSLTFVQRYHTLFLGISKKHYCLCVCESERKKENERERERAQTAQHTFVTQ